MDKLAEILESARALTPDERRRLLHALADADVEETSNSTAGDQPLAGSAVEALLQLAGSTTSEHSDLSTDKYKHAAAAASTKR